MSKELGGAGKVEDVRFFILARAIHVVSVVIWIGGVAFVTLVLLPSLNKISATEKKLELFELLEGNFAFYARIFTLTTGLSGFYMLQFMHAWNHYLMPQFWWLHLMTFIWILFTLVLFVLEPLFLHRWFHEQALKNNLKAFKLVTILHFIVLLISLFAVFSAVAGAHGFYFF